jgi:hypothetical protein
VGTGTVSAPSAKVAWNAGSGGLSVPALAGVGAGQVPGGALFLLRWRASTFSIESAARLAHRRRRISVTAPVRGQ